MTPRERLERAIIAIETEHEGVKFNMGWWHITRSWFDDSPNPIPHGLFNSCDSAACAFGHCALDSMLADEGLRFVESLFHPGTVVRFGDCESHEAAVEFFDIDMFDACYIFDPDRYTIYGTGVDRADVVRRVRQVLVGGERDEEEYEPC